MEVRFLRTVVGAYGIGRRNSVLDVSDKLAVKLVNMGVAEEVAAISPRPAPSAPVAEPAADEIDDLRAAAESLGIEVDRRWGGKRLRTEIEKARG